MAKETKGTSARAQREAEMKALRTKQMEDLDLIIERVQDKSDRSHVARIQQLPLLESVSKGLYEEIDKLCKKAPAEPITDLGLEQVNDVIIATKELAQGDPYIQKLTVFVPAGDNPQQRDVVIVLRQIRQGLERFRNNIDQTNKTLQSRMTEASLLRAAVQLFLEGHERPDKDDFDEYDLHLPDRWSTGIYPKHFNFDKLDKTNLQEYFSEVE